MPEWTEWLLAVGIICFWAFVWWWTRGGVEDDDEHYGDFVG